MEAFLRELLPRLIGTDMTFQIHPHQGKRDLLGKLNARLRGYARWLPQTSRIVVIVDRDKNCCEQLKHQLENMAEAASLVTRSSAGASSWQVVNRIAVEELEAWYFGDWSAVRRAYPGVSKHIPEQAKYRNPDSISGGTWEAFERVLQKSGYYTSGLRKIEAAQKVGRQIEPALNASPSFSVFRDALLEAVK